jgi:hypothetical protein
MLAGELHGLVPVGVRESEARSVTFEVDSHTAIAPRQAKAVDVNAYG